MIRAPREMRHVWWQGWMASGTEQQTLAVRNRWLLLQQSSWIEMLTEIDLKINESKVCSLDDILPGFSKLTEEEQQQMIGIVQSIGKKSLPKGRDLKDTYSVIHKTLMMATLSKSYRREKVQPPLCLPP